MQWIILAEFILNSVLGLVQNLKVVQSNSLNYGNPRLSDLLPEKFWLFRWVMLMSGNWLAGIKIQTDNWILPTTIMGSSLHLILLQTCGYTHTGYYAIRELVSNSGTATTGGISQ